MSDVSSEFKGRAGFERIVRAAGYSWNGLRTAYREEAAFRQETWVALPLLAIAFWLGRGWVEVTLLAGSVLLVLLVELLNSAVEAAIDRISTERHELSKRAKDYGSAAVAFALLLCAGAWAGAIWARWSA